MFRIAIIVFILIIFYEYFVSGKLYDKYGHIIQRLMYGKNGQKFDTHFSFSHDTSSKKKTKKSEKMNNSMDKVVNMFKKDDIANADYEEIEGFAHLSEAYMTIRSEYAQIIVDTNTYGKVTIKLIKDSEVNRYYLYIGEVFVLSGQNKSINWQLAMPQDIQADIIAYIQDQILIGNYQENKNIINDTPINLASIQHIFSGYVKQKHKK